MSDPRQVLPAHQRLRLSAPSDPGASDPLRLCVMTTVALLGWLLGPFAVLFFAVLGIVGYVAARRAGLLRSRCKLGDTRLVIAYLLLVAVAAAVAAALSVSSVLSGLR